ncbi:DUF1848 domain-containing protein [Paenibacillus macerans]|uniref:DUF1848 domain-containing protein n=1 Tax=Paenibacillus macerans TaxID=44252 RepID=UPI000F577C10|nr:DUF1848 domain-containing protein [Paenibacillus macerans]MEC0139133.1 DUF1848 domain-containing protein [Paenibacillus macerans]
MIISASRRTDIPAFFGDWFMRRIAEGYFHRVNPFNYKQVTAFSLLPEDVDGMVFWTKNPKPFMRHLSQLDDKGYMYYFQYTLNDYPEIFEPNLPPAASRVDYFRELSERLGANRVIWRYDPIIISNITPVGYHLERMERLAAQLEGYTYRLVISFMDYYGKTVARFKKLQQNHAVLCTDITLPDYREQLDEFAANISRIGAARGISVETCSEAADLDHCGIRHGSCIDARLLSSIIGRDLAYAKDKNQRDTCLCTAAVDVGVYNTCRFNCQYCYAVQSENTVAKTLQNHIIDSPSLIYKYSGDLKIHKKKN